MLYTIVTAPTADYLVQQVNDSLDEGWDLQGGVSLSVDGSGNIYFAQAMTLDDAPPP